MGLTILDPNGANTSSDGEYERIGDIKPGWQAAGDATPHSIASTSGGTGTITFSASRAIGESDLLIARDVLANGQLGKFSSVTIQGDSVALTSDTVLARLNTERAASTWATGFDAGDLPFPYPISVTFNGVAKSATSGFTVHGSDSYGGYVYVYGSFVQSGSVPVVMRWTDKGVFDRMWAASGGTVPDGSGQIGGGFTINRTSGFIYLTNPVQTGGAFIKRYTLTGTFVSEFRPGVSGGVATAGNSLAVDGSGNVYVSGGPTGSVIQKFNSAGTFIAAMGTTATTGNFGFGAIFPKIEFDGQQLVVMNMNRYTLRTYTTALAFSREPSLNVQTGNQMPAAMTVDRTNSMVYVLSARSGSSGDQAPTLWTYSTYATSPTYTMVKKRAIRHSNTSYIGGIAADGKGRLFVPNVTFSPLSVHTMSIHFERDGKAPLSTMIHYYLCLVMKVGDFEFRFTATDPTVLFEGWTGSVWEYLKELATAFGLEYSSSVTPDGLKFKPVIEVGTTGAQSSAAVELVNAGSLSLTIDMNNTVRSYEVIAQNPTEAAIGDASVVYTTGRDGPTFSVEPGRVIYTQVNTPHSIVSARPLLPELASWPAQPSVGYEVWDSDNVRLPTGLFTSYAGNVQAHVIDEHTIGLVITGPYIDIPGYTAPYKFASPSGEGRLNLGGSGTLINPKAVTIWTGADEAYVTSDSGPRIDSPFIVDLNQLYNRAAWASLELSGPRMELRYEVVGTVPTPGQRVSYNYQNWRIMSVDRTATGANVTAVSYTTVGDKAAAWSGKTVAQYDAFWSGYRVYDSKVRPLQASR